MDSCLRNFAEIVTAYARSFNDIRLFFFFNSLHGLAQLGRIHVVEENNICPSISKYFLQALHRLYLNFNFGKEFCFFYSHINSRFYSPIKINVRILDKRAVIKSGAMHSCSTNSYRMFIHLPVKRIIFSGIQKIYRCAFYLFHFLPSVGSNARKTSQYIADVSLHLKENFKVSFKSQQNITFLKFFPFFFIGAYPHLLLAFKRPQEKLAFTNFHQIRNQDSTTENS